MWASTINQPPANEEAANLFSLWIFYPHPWVSHTEEVHRVGLCPTTKTFYFSVRFVSKTFQDGSSCGPVVEDPRAQDPSINSPCPSTPQTQLPPIELPKRIHNVRYIFYQAYCMKDFAIFCTHACQTPCRAFDRAQLS
jgi:hypothetical protein